MNTSSGSKQLLSVTHLLYCTLRIIICHKCNLKSSKDDKCYGWKQQAKYS